MEKPEIVSGVYLPNEVSQSKLKRYETCPKMTHYQDVLRVRTGREPVSASLPMGSAFHEAVEVFHETIRKGFEPDMDVLMNLIEKSWKEQYESYVAPNNLDHAREVGTDSSMGYDWRVARKGTPLSQIEGAHERAVKNIQWWFECYVEAYNNGVLDIMKDISVGCEIDYRRELDHLGIVLRGKLDVVFNNKHLGDWKTANPNPQWNWSQDRADGEVQASYYAALMNEDEIEFSYIVIDKQVHPDYARGKKGPQKCDVKVITTKRTRADIQEVVDRLEQFVMMTDIRNGYKEGIFPRKPKPMGETFCDNFCDYKTRCHADLMKERSGA